MSRFFVPSKYVAWFLVYILLPVFFLLYFSFSLKFCTWIIVVDRSILNQEYCMQHERQNRVNSREKQFINTKWKLIEKLIEKLN